MTWGLSSPERIFVRIVRLLMQPGRLILAILKRVPIGSYQLRCVLDLYPRPDYVYGVQQAAILAQRLGVSRISVIEFGVAGGRGLVELDRIAKLATKSTGVGIDVYGFDRGEGLPKPIDYRDLPYVWRQGDFTMNVGALKARAPTAELVLGDIEDTVPSFLAERNPAPIGFVSVDVDFYSSAAASLELFKGDHEYFLPRVFCYFDDTIGDDDQVSHNDFVGELCAISEFNNSETQMKLSRINGLSHKRAVSAAWNDVFYVLHRFDHPQYGTYVGRADAQTQLPLGVR